MVRRTLLRAVAAATIAAVSILSLGTCILFRDSMFPWYLSGVTDSLDLSQWIDNQLVPEEMSVYDWWADVAVLRNDAGTDYIFVIVGGFQDSRVIVLNRNLTLVSGMNPLDSLPLGRRAMVGAGDEFVIGNQIITGPPLALGGFVSSSSDTLGFSIETTDNCLFYVDNGTSPATLFLELYTSGWGGPSTTNAAVSSDLNDKWDIAAAVYDAQRPAGQRAVLLLRNWSSNDEAEIVYADETDLQGGTLLDPVLSYPGFSVTPDDGIERMHYTRKGILVRSNNQATLYRFSEDDTTTYRQDSRHDVIDAYDIDGEYFYVLDKDDRMLYKGRTGW